MFLNAHFLPFANYFNIIWDSSCKPQLHFISIIQRKALKTASKMEHRTSLSLVYFKSKTVSIRDLCEIQFLIFIFQYLNGLLPPTFCNLFVKRSNMARRSTQIQDTFYIKRSRLACYAASLYIKATSHGMAYQMKWSMLKVFSDFKSKL